MQLANSMALEFFDDTSLTKDEQNEQSSEWLERALYDDQFTSKYREVFQYYARTITRKKEELAGTLAELNVAIVDTETVTADFNLAEQYRSQQTQLSEATLNLTNATQTWDRIITELNNNFTRLKNYSESALELAISVDRDYLELIKSNMLGIFAMYHGSNSSSLTPPNV